jgi:DNA-binding CsgD family transcriptional regulator
MSNGTPCKGEIIFEVCTRLLAQIPDDDCCAQAARPLERILRTISAPVDGLALLSLVADLLETVDKGDEARGLCDKLAVWLRATVSSDLDGKDSPGATHDRGPKMITKRECEVLKMLGLGMPNKAIAAKMNISCKTVKTHINHLSRKLGITNRTQAALLMALGDLPAVGCRSGWPRPRTPRYDVHELLYRPVEHILEELPCQTLGEAMGLGHTTAWNIKRGRRPLEEREAAALRRWLASQDEAAYASGRASPEARRGLGREPVRVLHV